VINIPRDQNAKIIEYAKLPHSRWLAVH
jgi:hypothetical protein